jgi:hypothetical protein
LDCGQGWEESKVCEVIAMGFSVLADELLVAWEMLLAGRAREVV